MGVREAAFAAIILVCVTGSAMAQDGPLTAIVGALDIEVMPLANELVDPAVQWVEGVPFTLGMLQGRRVVIAALGVGKVNAAITTTLLVEHFRPAEVIFTGIAGALDGELLPGDVVVARHTAQHDVGTLTSEGLDRWGTRSIDGVERNPVLMPSAAPLLDAARRVAGRVVLSRATGAPRPARVVEGTVLTGDVFVASRALKEQLRSEFGAAAVEMEGAAVAQVCAHFGDTPFIVIRGISDAADDAAFASALEFREVAVGNAARLARALVAELAAADARAPRSDPRSAVAPAC